MPRRTSRPTSRRTARPRNAGSPTLPTPGRNSSCGFPAPPGVGSRAGMAEMSPFLAELAPLAGATGQAAGGPARLPEAPQELAAVVHPESVEETSLPAESPLTQDLEVALWPYDPLEGPVDPRTGDQAPAGSGAAGRNGNGCRAGPRSREAAGDSRECPWGFRFRTAPAVPQPRSELGTRKRRCCWSAATAGTAVQDVHLPGHISASTLRGPGRRSRFSAGPPAPAGSARAGHVGTQGHGFPCLGGGVLRLGTGMLDLDEAPGSDNHIDEAYGLDSMVETFRNSEWAHRAPGPC